MKEAINILQQKWNFNTDSLEYMPLSDPRLDVLLKENESIMKAIEILNTEKSEQVTNSATS